MMALRFISLSRCGLHTRVNTLRVNNCLSQVARHRQIPHKCNKFLSNIVKQHEPLDLNAADLIAISSADSKMEPIYESVQQAKDALTLAETTDEMNTVLLGIVQSKVRSGHAAFVNFALEEMKAKEIKPNLLTLDCLVAVFPENNSFITKTLFDAIWPAYGVQTEAMLKVLDHMEENFIIPEASTNALMVLRFGRASPPVNKIRRMAFWMRRFCFANPFEIPETASESEKTLLLLNRLSGSKGNAELLRDEGSTLAMACYTDTAERLEQIMNYNQETEFSKQLFIEGPLQTWAGRKNIDYYVLLYRNTDGDIEKDIVLSLCYTEEGTLNDLETWIKSCSHRHKELSNFTINFPAAK
eukprot:m.94909 g.94909  ORF g.94909 m.94909 type:complete len:356 (-) comp13466_c0_seq1:353-1420(-)